MVRCLDVSCGHVNKSHIIIIMYTSLRLALVAHLVLLCNNMNNLFMHFTIVQSCIIYTVSFPLMDNYLCEGLLFSTLSHSALCS